MDEKEQKLSRTEITAWRADQTEREHRKWLLKLLRSIAGWTVAGLTGLAAIIDAFTRLSAWVAGK